MKQFTHAIEKSLRNGLPPDQRIGRNAPYLLRMDELKPTEMGAVSPELVTYPPGAVTVEHPRPSIHSGEVHTVLFPAAPAIAADATYQTWNRPSWVSGGTGTFYEGSDYPTLASPYQWQASNSKAISFCSFQRNWVATDGRALFVKMASETKALASVMVPGGVCNHRDRLVIAGGVPLSTAFTEWPELFNAWRETQLQFSDEDMDGDEGNWIFWGEDAGGDDEVPFHFLMAMLGVLGETEFNKWRNVIQQRIAERRIGWLPFRAPGKPRNVMVLGDDLIVYGDNCISRMRRDERGGYADELLAMVGIKDRCAVAGDADEHIFVATTGDLYRVTREGVKRLGYSQFLSSANETVVSFDPMYRDFWINDGVSCYVWTGQGLGGPMTVKPTHLFRDQANALVGVADGLDATSFTPVVKTNTLDWNERGTKHIGQVGFHGEALSAMDVTLYGRNDHTEAFYAWPSNVPFGPKGVAFPRRSAVDLQLELSGTVTAPDAEIHRLEVGYNAEDRTFRRGTKASVPDS